MGTTQCTTYKMSVSSVSGYADTGRSRVSLYSFSIQNGHPFCKLLLKDLLTDYDKYLKNNSKDKVS